MKISFREKGMVALTAVVLVLTTGVFLMQNGDPSPYRVLLQTRWASEVGAGVGKADADTSRVNINTAGEAELQTLPGIGPALAKSIVEERRINGPFRIPEDITRVPGIGQGKLREIHNYITVG